MTTTVNVTGTASVQGSTITGTGTVSGTLTIAVTGAAVADATNLVATPGIESAVLQWTPAAGASSYTVDYRSVIPGLTPSTSYGNAVTISGSNTTIANLYGGRSYEFRVRANFTGGSQSTGISAVAVIPDSVITPTAPQSLRVTASSASSLSIAWNSVLAATGYRVFIRPSTGAYTTVPNASPAGTTYDFVGLSASTAYVIKVLAVNGNVDGPGAEISFSTPASTLGDPSSLTVPGVTDGTVSLAWVAGDGAASYLVDWKVTGAANYGLPVETSALAYTVLGLSAGTGYTFRVRSKSGTTISTGTTTTKTTLGAASGNGSTPIDLEVGTYSGSAAFTVKRPASSSGDSYYLFLSYKDGDTYSIGTATSFVSIADVNGTGHPGRVALFEKITSGESAGDLTVTPSGTVNVCWAMLRTRGARRATTQANAAFANPFVAPSVTATTGNAPIFNFVASGQWPRAYTFPTGVTELGQTYNPSGPGIAVGFFTVDAAASGARSYTAIDPATSVDAGDDYLAISLALDGTPVATTAPGTINGSTVVVTTPPANAGDSIYVGINYQDSSLITLATPSGWTLRQAQQSAQGGAGATKGTLSVFSRDVAASEATASTTFAFSGAVTGAWVASRHRGAYRASAKATGASTTSFVAPAVTAATDGSTWLSWVAPGHYNRTHTAPAGFTEQADQAGGGAAGPSIALGTKPIDTGSSGTATWVADTSDDYNAVSVVIDGTGGSTGGGTGGGGGNSTTSFYVGGHVHGYETADRYAANAYPATNGPAGDNTMYPAKFGSFRTWDNESGISTCQFWTGRTGGINAVGDGLNQYNYAAVDTVLDKLVARGHVPMMLVFNGTPAWAARNTDESSYGPGGVSMPTNLTAWAQACRDVILRCRTRYGTSSVKWVEIGNECIGGGDSSVSQFLNARGWPAGSSVPIATLYADMCAALAPLVKAIDSSIQIVIGAHTYLQEDWTRMLLGAKSQAGVSALSHADIFSVHLYGCSRRNQWRNLMSETAKVRQWLSEYGYPNLPLADTEFGFFYPWGGAEESAWYASLSESQRSDYIYEAFADRKALGYVGAWWYSADASPAPGKLSFFYEPERTSWARDVLNRAYDDFNR